MRKSEAEGLRKRIAEREVEGESLEMKEEWCHKRFHFTN